MPDQPLRADGGAGIARSLAMATADLVARLGPEAWARVLHPFLGERRRDWHYTPRTRAGLPLGEMAPAVAESLWELLARILSPDGRRAAEAVLVVERILGELTSNPVLRDPGNYALAVFGDPSGAAPWSLRFEGHHLSINVTVLPGVGVSATPTFFGSNPARVPDGHAHGGFRLLGAEEDEAFALVRGLGEPLRARAIIADRSLGDIVAGPGRERMAARFEGIPLADLSLGERDAVMALAARFVTRLSDPIAAPALERLRDDLGRGLAFAWAGSLMPGIPHYFRIHGPRTLIEYDNTQNGANHVHTVFIDPQDPFGDDLLAHHHAAGHRHDHPNHHGHG